ARALYRERVWRPRREWRLFLLRVGIANLMMAVVLAWTAGSLEGWTGAPAMVRAGRLAVTIVAAAVAYFALLYAMGMRPARYLRRT
ncbi:MAG: murein biosynthesis integral membrane protein MurJ, partial [Pseudomonadota bacterium]|nr:murein biosynthesis integral membrane protein MurJ [Pseudomonadota bacterium]